MNVIIKKSRFYKSAKRNRDGRETGREVPEAIRSEIQKWLADLGF